MFSNEFDLAIPFLYYYCKEIGRFTCEATSAISLVSPLCVNCNIEDNFPSTHNHLQEFF